MTRSALACALMAGAALVTASTDAFAASAQQQQQQQMAQIPRCGAKLGVIAIEEPQRNWWSELHLGSPEAQLKVLVDRSGCFDLVDRGAGLAAAQRERALSGGGQLRQGSNIGGGQIVAADYVLVPDILSQNGNASGNNVGAALGGLLGSRFGPVGAIAGGIRVNSSTADVTLTVTDVRSTRQLATIDGHSKKTDVGFALGGGVFGGSGFGAGGATGYNNTEIGQVIMLAYIDAYAKLVDQLGGALPVEGASAANAQQSVVTNRPTRMYRGPATSSGLVVPLDPGARLYPTGNKDGLMWEVKDEKGNLGWVSSITFDLQR
jgi:curli biogenesis system outer membrane secretion channel CsgG